MKTARPILLAVVAALGITLPVVGAQSSVQPRTDMHSAAPRAYSAIEGMSVRDVMAVARTLPTTTIDPAQPWCDLTGAIDESLRIEFGEQRIASQGGLVLYGSDEAGTFTLVMPRADKTSCVVGSGTGYRDASNPDRIYSVVLR
ncbi:MAG: hypothetical protein DI498_01385 [Paracoccus denitrificans]|nr:MAG: hypothetical protein DI498_01385 [Paracoccus denitrificans]PZO85821.1 MAG: hypothetical protein DI633_01385 [Paracoccus denitrificans]